MIYYGIVEKIKDEHKSGMYGRRKATKEEISQLICFAKKYFEPLFLVSPLLGAGLKIINRLNKKDIVLQKEDKNTSKGKTMVI